MYAQRGPTVYDRDPTRTVGSSEGFRRAVCLPSNVQTELPRQRAEDPRRPAGLPAEREVFWRRRQERGVHRLARELVRGHDVVALPEPRLDVGAVRVVVRVGRAVLVRSRNVGRNGRPYHPERDEQHADPKRAQFHVERVGE
jgi:hypothetical protein